MSEPGVVLVTGATGTVGSLVVQALLGAGEQVRAASTHARPSEPGGPQWVEFDVTRPETLAPAFAGVDRMFLMRPPAISDVTTYLRPVVQLAAAHRLRLVAFLSLMGVNRAMPHWKVERDIRAAGLPYTFLRAAFFDQNLESAYRADISERDEIRLPAGQGRTSFVDAKDVAEVAAVALREPETHAGTARVITGPAALGWGEVASILSAELGRPITYRTVGLLAYRRELLAQGYPSDYATVQLLINTIARLGRAAAVTDCVPRLLGRPATPLADYVARAAPAWVRTG